MKCVKKGKEIKRVTDSKAIEMVEEHGWVYCPKHEFKEQNKKK